MLSCGHLFAPPWTVALQAPLSLRFSRQEHWSGLPFPSPMHERKSESEVAQSCPTLSDPMDCSLPGSSVHGVFQARVLEWLPLSSPFLIVRIHYYQASQVVLVVKNMSANAEDIRDVGSIPGLGGSPGERNGNSLQYSCWDNPMGRGAWWASVREVTKSWTRLRD